MKIIFIVSIVLPLVLLSTVSKDKEIKLKPSYLTTPNSELCNENNCPPNKGVCTPLNVCSCFDGYLTEFNKDMTAQCSYEQKKKMLFLLLEFPGFGIGHFYAKRYIFGAIKLVLDVTIFIFFCFCGATNNKGRQKEGAVNLMLMLVYFGTQFADLALIMSDYYLDGNGMEFGQHF
ncbi:MAG: hypothetical protein MJ252_20180 [archaeon]|nr:hypothetical protein [archaeon]